MISVQVALQPFDDGDDIELDEAIGQLHEELRELDVDKIDRVPVPIAAGAKPAEAFALGALVLAVAPTIVEQVGAVIVAWLDRANVRSATISIDGDELTLTKASKNDQRELLRIFAERHGGK